MMTESDRKAVALYPELQRLTVDRITGRHAGIVGVSGSG
jgi:hypothetical protein